MTEKHELNAILTTILAPFLKPGQTIECQTKTTASHQTPQEFEPIINYENGKKISVQVAVARIAAEHNALRDFFFKKHRYNLTTDTNTGTPVIPKHKFGDQPLSVTEVANKHTKELDKHFC